MVLAPVGGHSLRTPRQSLRDLSPWGVLDRGLGVSRGAHMNCSGHASVSFPASAFAGPEWLHL